MISFPSRVDQTDHLSTRQYAGLVDEWVTAIGLRCEDYGAHSLRRTKAAVIYKTTGNLRAIQILLGHTKIENTVSYLGVISKMLWTSPSTRRSKNPLRRTGRCRSCIIERHRPVLGAAMRPYPVIHAALTIIENRLFDLVGATIEMVEEPGRIDDCERTLQLCTDCGCGNRQSVIPKLAQARGTSLSPDDSTSSLIHWLERRLVHCFGYCTSCYKPASTIQSSASAPPGIRSGADGSVAARQIASATSDA